MCVNRCERCYFLIHFSFSTPMTYDHFLTFWDTCFFQRGAVNHCFIILLIQLEIHLIKLYHMDWLLPFLIVMYCPTLPLQKCTINVHYPKGSQLIVISAPWNINNQIINHQIFSYSNLSRPVCCFHIILNATSVFSSPLLTLSTNTVLPHLSTRGSHGSTYGPYTL